MARHSKATVDYFPHNTCHGKTLFVLEKKWGNDGYAVWFKLLERLGATDGHYIDCRDSVAFIHLSAYCGVSEAVLLEIIDMLAELDAIDRDLWRQQCVYCQHFVDGIVDAYRRRINSLPNREKVFAVINKESDGRNKDNDGRSTERERERERERKDLKHAAEKPPVVIPFVERQIRQAIDEKRLLIEEKYPDADIEIETEEIIAKYRGQTIGADPWVIISRWFKNLKKPQARGRESPAAVNRERLAEEIREHNRQVCREFANA